MPNIQKSTAMTVKKLLLDNKAAIAAALPKHVSIDRIMRVAVTAIATNPDLQECTAASLFSAIVKSATLGLEPNGPLGEAYMVPFKNRKKGIIEVQFMPGYRGLIVLARRSGFVSLIYAEVIKENDDCKVTRGLNPDITHNIPLKSRGKTIGYYAVYKTISGDFDFEVMMLDEIEAVRNRSKAAQNGPWVTDFDEMAKKTVIKRLTKRMPMSVELAGAIELDHEASMGEAPDYSDAITTAGIEIPDIKELTENEKVAEKTIAKTDKLKAKVDALRQQDAQLPIDIKVEFRKWIGKEIGIAKTESYLNYHGRPKINELTEVEMKEIMSSQTQFRSDVEAHAEFALAADEQAAKDGA